MAPPANDGSSSACCAGFRLALDSMAKPSLRYVGCEAAEMIRVALTGDFLGPDGRPQYRDLGLDGLQSHPEIECRYIADHRPEIDPEQIEGSMAVIVLTPRVTARTVSRSDDLLAIARFGVGFDSVDVPACTRANVVVLIAKGAVDRPVAEATVGWMLALSHNVRQKDRLVREGRWGDRSGFMGCELRDRVLGVIGLGGIGRALIKLLKGFGMAQPMAYDPFVTPEDAAQVGVRLVELDELLLTADFVSIHCPLTEETRNLISTRELSLLKPKAYLINTARGGIVDEEALYPVLRDRRIAGAALDCFAEEPVVAPHRLGELENVMLAPHCIAWTEELFRDIGRTVCRGLVALTRRERPLGVVNPQVFAQRGFLEKWERLTSGVRP
jgi:phosphoglycerate dehydrogenase-like enzyme